MVTSKLKKEFNLLVLLNVKTFKEWITLADDFQNRSFILKYFQDTKPRKKRVLEVKLISRPILMSANKSYLIPHEMHVKLFFLKRQDLGAFSKQQNIISTGNDEAHNF